ncbi:hypothetical protein SEA_A3WALLY_246 [Microbacterium phage A3Wally]|nr:hypothetical protein SEA_A3WALLY_246 [Microbacterium phage A3Wally]
MHLVYYLQNPGEEFRYSLRSAAAHADVDRVTVIGDAPSWLKKAKVLDGNPTANAHINSVANAHIAARAFRDDFVMMNDDFYFLRDITEPIPLWYFRSMTQHMGLYTDPRSAQWKKLYMDTTKYLTDKRVMMPKSFELHIPMQVNGVELDQVLTASASDHRLAGPGLWRSIYGNLAPSLQHRVAVKREDVKVHSAAAFESMVDFASTDEKTMKNILPILRERFPERSPWEKR